MNPLLLPREVTATDAWVGVVWPGAQPPASMTIVGGPAEQPVGAAWQPVFSIDPRQPSSFQRAQVSGLSPGTSYQLALVSGGQVLAQCRLKTLPDALPSASLPLNMLIASCYSELRDGAGALGRAYARLPAASQPDLAIMMGDQVYLDTPVAHFLLRRHTPEQLAFEFASNYQATWAANQPDTGFGPLATGVAAFLSGDDHELWNNAPTPAVHLPDTWTGDGREIWSKIAALLFDAYQTPRRLHALELPPLSIRSVDTRFARAADHSVFMDPQAMTEIAAWLLTLSGPGMLILGQPIFVTEAGWRGNLADWGLPDFAQYDDLVRALTSVQHDVLVVTGDVHFGRVAEAVLPNGSRLVEIIASPMVLVDDRAGRSWHEPPSAFPARPVPCAPTSAVTVNPYRTIENHFSILSLWAEGQAVRVDHSGWEIGVDGSLPRPVPGYSGRLQ
jgi:hypothetical protein